MQTDPAKLAASLTEAQRRIILAGSARHPKKWNTLRRHAKLNPAHVGIGLGRFFETDRHTWWLGTTLNELGQAVKAHLQEHSK